MEEWKSRTAHTSSESKDCGIFIVKRIDSVGVCSSWNTVIEWRLEENLARRVEVSRSHDKHSFTSGRWPNEGAIGTVSTNDRVI
jgi:hypothetical protein